LSTQTQFIYKKKPATIAANPAKPNTSPVTPFAATPVPVEVGADAEVISLPEEALVDPGARAVLLVTEPVELGAKVISLLVEEDSMDSEEDEPVRRIKLVLLTVPEMVGISPVIVLTIWVGLSALTRNVQAFWGPGVSTIVSVCTEKTISSSGMVFVVQGPTLVV
jgi:hypothetical protein